jgi:hypothetical protein
MRTCIFCGAKADTEEHVFPDWIGKVIVNPQLEVEAVEISEDGHAVRRNYMTDGAASSLTVMGTVCWCGCDRELGWSDARIAKRGREAYALVTILEDDYRPLIKGIEERGIGKAGQLEELDDFIAHGEKLTAELLMVAHGELPADTVDRRLMNGWGKIGAKLLKDLPPSYRSRKFRALRKTVTLRDM